MFKQKGLKDTGVKQGVGVNRKAHYTQMHVSSSWNVFIAFCTTLVNKEIVRPQWNKGWDSCGLSHAVTHTLVALFGPEAVQKFAAQIRTFRVYRVVRVQCSLCTDCCLPVSLGVQCW